MRLIKEIIQDFHFHGKMPCFGKVIVKEFCTGKRHSFVTICEKRDIQLGSCSRRCGAACNVYRKQNGLPHASQEELIKIFLDSEENL